MPAVGNPHGDRFASISVIIVAFQSAHVIDRAISSIGPCREIICVDNASSDGIETILSDRDVVHIRNEHNQGYPRACNRGAEIATGEFLLFMNPDVELGADALAALAMAVERYPDVDVFTPRTVTGEGKSWYRVTTKFERLRNPSSLRLSGKVVGDCCVRFVDGGVFLIRRSTFLALGGLDERIFMYFEDDDLSLRLLAAGHKIVYVHDAMAVHRIGTSCYPSRRYVACKAFHKKRSEFYFNAKYGIPTNINRERLAAFAKMLVYCLTLRPGRALAAYGRLRGVLSLTKTNRGE